LPRGVSAEWLIKALEAVGYVAIRQKGSHVRLRHPGGTMHGILTEVALMQSTTVNSPVERL